MGVSINDVSLDTTIEANGEAWSDVEVAPAHMATGENWIRFADDQDTETLDFDYLRVVRLE